MKTYENLKKSYSKFLNMDFYVYDPDLEKTKEKEKYEIVYEPIIMANKESSFVQQKDGHYYVMESDIDKVIIPDDIYGNMLLKALAFNLSYYGVPHFDEIYATATEDDLKGTYRQLCESAGRLLLQYCDKKNKLIKFTEKDYKEIGSYIGRFCVFSTLYINKTVYTIPRLILKVKTIMNTKVRTLEPYLTHIQQKNNSIYIIKDQSLIDYNNDCVALKKNEKEVYIHSVSLKELIIPKEKYNNMCTCIIIANLDFLGLEILQNAKTDIIKYAITNHYDTVELLSSYWLIDFCRKKGMFPQITSNSIDIFAKGLAKCGEFPKKCAAQIPLPQITNVEITKNTTSLSEDQRAENNKIIESYLGKETEVRTFISLINQCGTIVHGKDPIVYEPLLVEVKKLFRKSDTYTIQDERIIKANQKLNKIFKNGDKYQIKKEDIHWLMIPDSIYDDLLLDLIVGNVDYYGNLFFDSDSAFILKHIIYPSTLEECAKWFVEKGREQGLITNIPPYLYDDICDGLVKNGTFPTRYQEAAKKKFDKEVDEELALEKQRLEDEKWEEQMRNDY